MKKFINFILILQMLFAAVQINAEEVNQSTLPKAEEGTITIKEHTKYPVNSREYWDARFKAGDWQDNKGGEQTLHFYTLLVNAIPQAIQEEIFTSKYKIFDFGCAQGEGTEYFANIFSNAEVTGIDISEEGIKIAKSKHHKAKFLAVDLTKMNINWDILISSNTFEHFTNPWEILGKLSLKTNKYLIILIPFEQLGVPVDEHLYSFNHNNIPKSVKGFDLVYSKIVYPDPKFWDGKQILLIYKNALVQ